MAGRDIQYGGAVDRQVTPVTEERAAYNEIVRAYAKTGAFGSEPGQDKVAILKAEIRSEVVVGAGVNSITWNVRADQPNQGQQMRSTENRLDINDAFAIRQMAIVWGDELTTDPDGTMTLHTFDNPVVFTVAACVAAIRQGYNGRFSFEVNTVRYMDALGASAFRYVDYAQQGFGPALAMPRSSWNQTGSFVNMIPQVIIQGNDKVVFQLQLSDAGTFATTDRTITAVLLLRGLRIQNGAMFRSARP